MLKINRDVNFDQAVGVILHTSIDWYFDLRHKLDNSELDDSIFIINDD